MNKVVWCALACVLTLTSVTQAHAFCGFYVSGGDADLFNDATQVVLMREGTRTALSMQNNYEGPAKGFAMVVPVPVVLMAEDVKTLPDGLFEKVDRLSAPRLVEYFERDPCDKPKQNGPRFPFFAQEDVQFASSNNASEPAPAPVVEIEAEFAVGEYEIVILSAEDASGLDTWLRQNNYNIPQGAEPLFKAYIEQGMYFFVARIDPSKVTYNDGKAVLSPLRFDYDSPDFALPVRLGMVNSQGSQDLIVNILAKERYEVANYPNVTIPTNLEVDAAVKDGFGGFYTRLFDETLVKNPGAVVTEYAWGGSASDPFPAAFKCDPCPEGFTPEGFPLGPLDGTDLGTLGADVLFGGDDESLVNDLVLTRLHARYAKDSITDDLVFRSVRAIGGGRETDNGDALEKGARNWDGNRFQGRYIIRNRWEGDVGCSDPIYERWTGGRGSTTAAGPNSGGTLRAAPGGLPLTELVREDVATLGLVTTNAAPTLEDRPAGCGCATIGAKDAAPYSGLMLALLGWLGWRRRQRGESA